jgi:hypothetical protein
MHGGLMAAQPPATGASPLTLALAATLVSYYLSYSIVLTLRMRRLAS